MDSKIDLGKYINQLRKDRNYTLKYVAEKLEIDLSLFSKIENGERQLQAHMLKPLADLFKLNYSEIQIQFLNQKIEDEYGDNPYFIETINLISNKNKSK